MRNRPDPGRYPPQKYRAHPVVAIPLVEIDLDVDDPRDHLQSILAWKADLAGVREEAAVVARANARTENEGHTHTQMPAWPQDLGLALDASQLAAAFEVEHSTSICSGIVRMLDLPLS